MLLLSWDRQAGPRQFIERTIQHRRRVAEDVPVRKVWAPEVHKFKGAYYLFVTLTLEKGAYSIAKLEEEREKSSKALEEERKNGICNLIEGCRKLGETLEKTCQLLMMCYHLTQSEASAYLKEYYV